MINRSPLEEGEIEKPIIHPTVSVKSVSYVNRVKGHQNFLLRSPK